MTQPTRHDDVLPALSTRPAAGRLWAAARSALSGLRGDVRDHASQARRDRVTAEQLEPRRLLVVLSGGESITFQDQEEESVTIEVTGDVQLVPIVSGVDEFGQATLAEISGDLTGRGQGTIPINGGFGATFGSVPVSAIFDPESREDDFVPTSAEDRLRQFSLLSPNVAFDFDLDGANDTDFDLFVPRDAVEVTTLATAANGNVFTVYQLSLDIGGTEVNSIQLASVDIATGNVVGATDLTGQLVAAINAGVGAGLPGLDPARTDLRDAFGEVVGADFNPLTNELFFVINTQLFLPDGEGDAGDVTSPVLFKLTGSGVERLPGQFGQNFNVYEPNVQGFAFQTPTDTDGDTIPDTAFATVLGTGLISDGTIGENAGAEEIRGLVNVNPNNTNDLRGEDNLPTGGITPFRPVITAEGSRAEDFTDLIEDVRGLEIIQGDTEFVYGISGDGEDSRLLRFRRPGSAVNDPDVFLTRDIGGTNGLASDAPNPDDGLPGQNVGGITFNDVLLDPFRRGNDDPSDDRDRGAFLITDTVSDQLLFLDETSRLASATLFSLYYLSDDPNAEIFIYRTGDDGPEPFGGGTEINAVNSRPIPPTEQFTVATGGQAGSVYIGSLIGEDLDTAQLEGDAGDLPIFLPGGRQLPEIVNPGLFGQGDIGKIFIGGTITGKVDLEGSIETLYAGSILTGTASGLPSELVASGFADNFVVDGDIANLITSDAIGSVEEEFDFYRSGFEMAVAGRVGQIVSLESGVKLTGLVLGDSGITERNNIVDEIEVSRNLDGELDPAAAAAFLNGGIIRDFADNGTFDTPQYVGLGPVAELDADDGAVRIQGDITGGNFGDTLDYYAIPLTAGQTITVRPTFGFDFADLAVFDPDGVLVASNFDDTNALGFDNSFTVTADKPGSYRIAVGVGLASSAFGGGGTIGTIPFTGGQQYIIDVTGGGELSLGAVVSRTNDVVIEAFGESLEVRGGAIGSIDSADSFYGIGGFDFIGGNDNVRPQVFANGGDIREITARGAAGNSLGNWGRLRDGVVDAAPQVRADGTLGRAFANGDIMLFNTLGTLGPGLVTNNLASGRIQSIEQVGQAPDAEFQGVVATLQGIGQVLVPNVDIAGGVAPVVAGGQSVFAADVDGQGADGEVGLIDVAGDFGDPGTGPALATGPGGNFRYMRVGGQAFKDAFFGGGSPDVYTSSADPFGGPGEITLRDDSGTDVTFSARNVDLTNPITPVISINALPVRGGLNAGGGGGNIFLSVDAGNSSLVVTAAGGGTTEISSVTIGEGAGVVSLDAFGQPDLGDGGTDGGAGGGVGGGGGGLPGGGIPGGFGFGSGGGGASGRTSGRPGSGIGGGTPDGAPGFPFGEEDLDPTLSSLVVGQPLVPLREVSSDFSTVRSTLLLQGGNVDVLSFTGTAVDLIENRTGGEIVSGTAGSIGTITADNIGFARPVAGMPLDPRANVYSEADFGVNTGVYADGTSVGIVAGEIFELRAREAVGNIITVTGFGDGGADGISTGSIETLVANSDGVNVRGVFEGIVGPILAISPDEATVGPGNAQIREVIIGEGVLPAGSGGVSRAGLYARGVIGLVQNQNGSDLRGDVVSNTGIDLINLSKGGSLIDANIGVIGGTRDGTAFAGNRFEFTNEFGRRGNVNSSATVDVFSNDDPSLNDSAERPITEIDRINATGGIIGTEINAADIGLIDAGGAGLITSSITSAGNGTIATIRASGLGIRDTVITGASEIGSVAANGDGSLLNINALDGDLSLAGDGLTSDPFSGKELDTNNELTAALGVAPTAGRVSGVTNSGLFVDSTVSATRDIGGVAALAFLGTRQVALVEAEYPNRISAGDRLGAVTSTAQIDGLQVSAGSIGSISAGGDASRLRVNSSGLLGSVAVGGSVRGSSLFQIDGQQGRIRSISVGNNFTGTVVTYNRLEDLVIGGSYGGTVRVREGAVNNVFVGGDYLTGGILIVDSAIRSVTIVGDLQADSLIRARGGFGDLDIGGRIDGVITQV